MKAAHELAQEQGVLLDGMDDQPWQRLRALAHGDEGTVIRAGVPASDVATLVGQASAMMGPAWGHIAAGAVWARPSADAQSLRTLRSHAELVGGFLQVEAASRELREQVDPFGSGDTELMAALKQQFDPNGTLNPGRWGAATTGASS
jgi:FAD/FMN-containing dehydrogenase